jgi:hypothetical protein
MQNFSGLCALATWVFSSVVSIELEETTIAKVRKIHHAPIFVEQKLNLRATHRPFFVTPSVTLSVKKVGRFLLRFWVVFISM